MCQYDRITTIGRQRSCVAIARMREYLLRRDPMRSGDVISIICRKSGYASLRWRAAPAPAIARSSSVASTDGRSPRQMTWRGDGLGIRRCPAAPATGTAGCRVDWFPLLLAVWFNHTPATSAQFLDSGLRRLFSLRRCLHANCIIPRGCCEAAVQRWAGNQRHISGPLPSAAAATLWSGSANADTSAFIGLASPWQAGGSCSQINSDS